MTDSTTIDRQPAAASRGLPGLRGVDHIGFNVPDLDAATAFLVNVLGCEEFYVNGPFRSDDDWMTRHLDIHPRAVTVRMKLFRLGYGANFEVFEYTSPDQSDYRPRNSDLAGHHIAIYVDDLDAAIAHLKAHDVQVFEKTPITTGPSAGETWSYFRTPWGLYMELVTYPKGKAYENDFGGRKLWDPRTPAA